MTGFLATMNTGTLPQWGTLFGGIIFAVAWWIRGAPERRRADAEADGSLRTDLLARIAKLEAQVEAMDGQIVKERDDCHRQIHRLEAQIQLFRHARNNADQRFNALLMLLKRSPDDVPGVIRLIEEMVAQQERALAAEKGAMTGTGLWSSNPVEAAAEQAVQATKDTLAEIKLDGENK